MSRENLPAAPSITSFGNPKTLAQAVSGLILAAQAACSDVGIYKGEVSGDTATDTAQDSGETNDTANIDDTTDTGVDTATEPPCFPDLANMKGETANTLLAGEVPNRDEGLNLVFNEKCETVDAQWQCSGLSLMQGTEVITGERCLSEFTDKALPTSFYTCGNTFGTPPQAGALSVNPNNTTLDLNFLDSGYSPTGMIVVVKNAGSVRAVGQDIGDETLYRGTCFSPTGLSEPSQGIE